MLRAMSTAMGDLIGEALAAYARGGFDAVLPLVHSEIEIFAPPELINSGEAHGHGTQDVISIHFRGRAPPIS